MAMDMVLLFVFTVIAERDGWIIHQNLEMTLGTATVQKIKEIKEKV